jgi:blue copper oxidase
MLTEDLIKLLKPGKRKQYLFTVDQEASTLWFHPHPEGETASQVYRGLAGLMYIDDENSDSLDIPKNYGVDDFPLIVQDKSFDSNNQINYEEDYYSDGTQGDNLLINGTINPYVDISKRWIRYRIVSGSNSRNFTFNLSNNDSFYQIASDGGFLNKAEN